MVLVGSSFQLNAQIDNENIEDQLKEMTTEMQKLMTEFQGLLGGSILMTDSLVQQGVLPLAENFKGFQELSLDSTDFNSLIDMMQIQMNQLSEQDWGELQKLMESFGENLPSIGKKDSKRSKTDI